MAYFRYGISINKEALRYAVWRVEEIEVSLTIKKEVVVRMVGIR